MTECTLDHSIAMTMVTLGPISAISLIVHIPHDHGRHRHWILAVLHDPDGNRKQTGMQLHSN